MTSKRIIMAWPLLLLAGCGTMQSSPGSWARVDGRPIDPAQLRADGTQCLAAADQVARTPNAGPRTVINNTVIVNRRQRSSEDLRFIDSIPRSAAPAPRMAPGDPDVLEVAMNGCMAQLGYIRRH
jgi:hypothetical protein